MTSLKHAKVIAEFLDQRSVDGSKRQIASNDYQRQQLIIVRLRPWSRIEMGGSVIGPWPEG